MVNLGPLALTLMMRADHRIEGQSLRFFQISLEEILLFFILLKYINGKG